MKLKLMILGYARHGKDTVAEILHNDLGLSFVSSSFTAAEKVMIPYFASKGIVYPDLATCYADRVNHRQEWFEQIKAYNTPDLAKLAREIYSENDIYVGIRNVEEFVAARDQRLFDYSIWVDRSKHVAPEPSTSNTINASMATHVIDNNGTLEELRIKTVALYWDLISLEYAAKGEKAKV